MGRSRSGMELCKTEVNFFELLFLFSFKQTVFFHLHILFALELQCSSVVQQLWVRIQDCG